MELLSQYRKVHCLPNFATRNQGRSPGDITNNKFRNLAWIFVTGWVGIRRGFFVTREKRAPKIRSKVAPFPGPNSAPLSGFFPTVLSPPNERSTPTPRYARLPLCLLVPGLWALRLSDTTEIPEGQRTCQELTSRDCTFLHFLIGLECARQPRQSTSS